MKYFERCTTLDELKKEYRKLAMMYHPDREGGDLAVMKRINAEHDDVFEFLKKKANATAESGRETTETPEEFREIIEKLIRMDGINVELCGSWLWISGETFLHREELKEAGCRWAKTKRMWFWHHAEDGAHRRGKLSMEAIREKYGSEKLVSGAKTQRIMAAAV